MKMVHAVVAMLVIIAALSSCCSGDDISGDVGPFQLQFFDADGRTNLFAFNGIYTADHLTIFRADDTTKAYYEGPNDSGLIAVFINHSEAIVDAGISTSTLFFDFGGVRHEFAIRYRQSSGRCGIQILELISYTFDNITTTPNITTWGEIVDIWVD